MTRLAAIAALALLAAPAAGAQKTAVPPCTAAALTGSFRAVPNSQGAGNIVYELRLRNAGHTACFLSGMPRLQLLGRTGALLPTHATPTHPSTVMMVVPLAPGKTAHATARFSPDVPGVGEQHPGACEKTAYTLRVTPSGGGTLGAPISPPTAVCERGGMSFSALT